MLAKFIIKLFELLIGKLPEDKKQELRKKGKELLMEAIKAGAEGAVKGVAK